MTNLSAIGTAGLLAVTVLAVACSGDDASSEAATPAADATPVPATATPAQDTAIDADERVAEGTDAGTARITIGSDTWTLDVQGCETGDEILAFQIGALGTIDGTRVQLSASITDGDEAGAVEGATTMHSVTLTDIEQGSDPTIAWTSLVVGSGREGAISVDGKTVSAEPVFDDETTPDDFERVEGSLVATCP